MHLILDELISTAETQPGHKTNSRVRTNSNLPQTEHTSITSQNSSSNPCPALTVSFPQSLVDVLPKCQPINENIAPPSMEIPPSLPPVTHPILPLGIDLTKPPPGPNEPVPRFKTPLLPTPSPFHPRRHPPPPRANVPPPTPIGPFHQERFPPIPPPQFGGTSLTLQQALACMPLTPQQALSITPPPPGQSENQNDLVNLIMQLIMIDAIYQGI